ncbi:hypothetical protein LJC60_05430 [Ruminococcaceae bacterium OttesenSCG-928-D13]|nr:hypothetical protein [Ruminococcaceae bacterium OttesenSCG-928-D13]
MTDLISAAMPLAPGLQALIGGVAPLDVRLDTLLTEHYLAELIARQQSEARVQAEQNQSAAEQLARHQLETLRLEEQARFVRAQQELLRVRPGFDGNYNDPEQLRRRVDLLTRTM